MLAFLRNSSLRPTQSWVAAASSRCFSISTPRCNDAEATEASSASTDAQPAAPTNVHQDGFRIKKGEDPRYARWLQGEGRQFRHAHRPKNWLGDDVPFPLNPSFKPPTPVSDRLRTIIWEQFIANPKENNVRVLSERYGLSIKRVDAILRLKGLEQHWIEKKPIQTGFTIGMEKILGVEEAASKVRKHMTEGSEMLGEDATKADITYDAFGNDEARHRYQRLFWEPHAETASPIVPRALEHARLTGEKHKLLKAKHKEDPELLGDQDIARDVSDDLTDVPKEFVVERGDRPAMKFINVGGKFIDVKDRRRRISEGTRRSRLRKNRRVRKSSALNVIKSGAETATAPA